ncbi:hypothetical protein [Methylobacillus rhizosphaerae]|nr:hypothetical protein [Methylobacillus rhizosphaerae]
MKPQPEITPDTYGRPGHWLPSKKHQTMLHVELEMQQWDGLAGHACPHGQPGDQLWVRETWQHSYFPYEPADPSADIFYRADFLDDPLGADLEHSKDGIRRTWKPSIHLPRWASRIQLEIVRVRVERLQDCSVTDAIDEGIEFSLLDEPEDAIWRYRELWESINGPGSWEANPFVWVIEFKRIEREPS